MVTSWSVTSLVNSHDDQLISDITSHGDLLVSDITSHGDGLVTSWRPAVFSGRCRASWRSSWETFSKPTCRSLTSALRIYRTRWALMSVVCSLSLYLSPPLLPVFLSPSLILSLSLNFFVSMSLYFYPLLPPSLSSLCVSHCVTVWFRSPPRSSSSCSSTDHSSGEWVYLKMKRRLLQHVVFSPLKVSSSALESVWSATLLPHGRHHINADAIYAFAGYTHYAAGRVPFFSSLSEFPAKNNVSSCSVNVSDAPWSLWRRTWLAVLRAPGPPHRWLFPTLGPAPRVPLGGRPLTAPRLLQLRRADVPARVRSASGGEGGRQDVLSSLHQHAAARPRRHAHEGQIRHSPPSPGQVRLISRIILINDVGSTTRSNRFVFKICVPSVR